MAIKHHTKSAMEEEKRPLGLSGQRKKEYKQEYFDIYSSVGLLDTKAIMKTPQAYIKLVEFGYLQFLSVPGKDLGSLSYAETQRTIENFEVWLTTFNSDIKFQTTTLPTNTTTQVADLRLALARVREERSQISPGSRRFLQLNDRETWLKDQIKVEENIQKEIYNTEFILWLFAPTTSELDVLVSRAKRFGNNDFVPREISLLKKKQIIKQYNNFNEKL